MFYNVVQKYFDGVVSRLRNFDLFKSGVYADFLIAARRLVGMEMSDGALEDHFIEVSDADTKEVIQRVAVGEVDGNGKTKKAWINITLTARKAVDVG